MTWVVVIACGFRWGFRKNKGISSARPIALVESGGYIKYGYTVHEIITMDSVSVNQFRDNLKTYVEQVVSNHEPIKVTRRAGDDFVVMSADDWEREQETLYVLQNNSLMTQIVESMSTHKNAEGYTPTSEQLNEITGI